MKKELLLTKIDAAKRDMSAAEADLEAVLSAIKVEPRAQKTTTSAAVEDAFKKLRAARAALGELEEIVANEEE